MVVAAPARVALAAPAADEAVLLRVGVSRPSETVSEGRLQPGLHEAVVRCVIAVR